MTAHPHRAPPPGEAASALDDHLLRGSAPRHVDLARDLLAGIRQGDPAVGDLLPTEAELCARTGLSRYAVRQAIQKLCGLGVVERRAGIGTRVLAREPVTRYTQVMDGLGDLTRYARDTVFQPEGRRMIGAGDGPEELRAGGTARWFHIHGLRYDPDREEAPIALVDIYLDSAFADAPGLRTVTDVPVFALIEAHYGIRFTRVDQVIRGALIEGEDAARLGVTPSSAGLRILRSYYLHERLVELTIGLHPAGRFSYSTSFALARPAPAA